MFCRWIKMVLALVLALMLPMAALADTQYTFSVIPGELLSSEQGIADLCETAALRWTQGERSSAISLVLDDESMITLGFAGDESGLYTTSPELLDDVLYMNWDELFAFTTDSMMTAYEDAGVEPIVLETLRTGMENFRLAIDALFEQEQETAAFTGVAVQEKLKQAEENFQDDPAMEEFFSGLLDGLVVKDGKYISDTRDTADEKIVLTMDVEDMIDLFDTAFMRNILADLLSFAAEQMSDDEAEEVIDELIEQIKKLYGDSDFSMTMEVYTADKGEALVGLDLDMNMKVDTQLDGEQVKFGMFMNADYNRLTSRDGVSYKAAASMEVDDEAIKSVFDLFEGENGLSKGMLGFLVDGEELVITYHSEEAPGSKTICETAVYLRSNATAILKPVASAQPIIGFKVVSEPAPAEVLKALENASVENSINVFKMSATDIENLMMKLFSNGARVYYKILGALPTSFLNFLSENNMI